MRWRRRAQVAGRCLRLCGGRRLQCVSLVGNVGVGVGVGVGEVTGEIPPAEEVQAPPAVFCQSVEHVV